MHDSQVNFCRTIREKFPLYFINQKVLDCGSLDINGSNRHLFINCQYLGIDIGAGRNVDVVTPIHLYKAKDNTYDTIISTECFEHDMFYKESLQNICRLLKPNGLFLFTCAGIGRPEHGTPRTTPKDSPFTTTSNIEEWQTYYKNLEEKDIREAIDIEQIFVKHEFSTNKEPSDLYFWGIKKDLGK
jgi:SAM-dependent methyltransferase